MMDTTMSDHLDPLSQQIAALESALRLPLPDATRAQIEQDLRALRQRRAAAIQGTVSVSNSQIIVFDDSRGRRMQYPPTPCDTSHARRGIAAKCGEIQRSAPMCDDVGVSTYPPSMNGRENAMKHNAYRR
jgi:hypothetical protein